MLIGISEKRYLYPYEDAVDCQIITIPNICKNIIERIKEILYFFLKMNITIKGKKIKSIGEVQKMPNSLPNKIFKTSEQYPNTIFTNPFSGVNNSLISLLSPYIFLGSRINFP